MEYIAALALIFGILRALFLFFRWVLRGLRRLGGPGPTFAPPQPMGQTLSGQSSLSTPVRMVPAPSNQIGQPVERQALRADFQYREAERDTPDRSAPAPSPTGRSLIKSPPTPGLFSSPNDLLRGIILQEVLGPPLSKRDRQHGTGSESQER